MVSEDMPLASTPLSTVISGDTPPGNIVDSHRDITAGSVVISRLERWIRPTSFSTAGWLGTGTSFTIYDTMRSVMKADLDSIDKTVGRPRDRRIDAAILSAAAELVVEVGYSNLTMAAIAQRAGTTKSALYRRWPSKAELVHEAAFAVSPSALTSSAGDVANDIQAMVSAARDVFASPVVRAALPGLIADMANDAELTARVLSRFEGLFDVLRQWTTEAEGRGDVRCGVKPDRLLEAIGGATLFGLLLRPGESLDDDWVHQTAAILAHGVMT